MRFSELLALGALAPLNVVILFRTEWLDDLHGNAALLGEFLDGTPRNSEPLSVWPPG